jgi:APA family basic amino acid/polyamine antiporter
MIRGIDLRGAVAVNMITMVGIGPLVTIPLVLSSLHGSLALLGWVVGALIGLCDGLVWAELGSKFPGSGGTYVFLRESFGRRRVGHFLSFLFVWQLILSAPLLLASGYIGFAHYAVYLWPALGQDHHIGSLLIRSMVAQGIVAAGVGVVTIVLLYRSIVGVAKVGIALCAVTLATLLAVIIAAFSHFNAAQAFSADPGTGFGIGLLGGLGSALIIALYDYAGYGDVCLVGDEVIAPVRTIPRAIVLSIVIVATLYIALQIGVLGVVPWQQLVAKIPGTAPPDTAQYVASTVVERVWGLWPAQVVTVAILVTAFASTFGNLLGFSRIPYAAALDGTFFSPFSRLHPTGRFPSVSLVVIGGLALPASFLTLDQAIAILTTGLVLVQSVAQVAATFAIRARGELPPFRMWLFPVPALLAGLGWLYIFSSAGTFAIGFGVLTVLIGAIVYFVRAWVKREWPFALDAQ